LALALALGCYEQAVMIPGLLFGVALLMRLRGAAVRWSWQAVFWGILTGYLALRMAILPAEASGYQEQQFRSGPGVAISILGYALPCAVPLWNLWNSLEVGWLSLLADTNLRALLSLFTNAGTILAARRRWLLPLAGWAMSLTAFLPMAWLKHFEHYHYLPMALRTLMVAGLLPIAIELWISAASRPALRAPPRPDPAPGSLARP
jgi:hypothetical protein